MRPILIWLSFILVSHWCLGQSGVVGSAPVTLLEGLPDCNGWCKTVEVYVDVQGLQGPAGPAGLNSFVLAFNLSRGQNFASVRRGTNPQLNWSLFATERSLVLATNRLVLVGAVAEPSAPNQNYHVATILLCGNAGSVNLSLNAAESSLGSRWVAGDGLGPIGFLPPALFQTNIQTGFPLSWGTGISSWLSTNPAYDLVDPTGRVTIADLVKLVNCGQP